MIHEINLNGVLQITENEYGSARGTFRYDDSDPYAVTVTFGAGEGEEDEDKPWIFARELLAIGLKNDVGSGDVKIRPTPEYGDSLTFSLCSPEGTAVLLFPLGEVAGFVEYTFRMVPFGAEGSKIDIDALINAINEEI